MSLERRLLIKISKNRAQGYQNWLFNLSQWSDLFIKYVHLAWFSDSRDIRIFGYFLPNETKCFYAQREFLWWKEKLILLLLCWVFSFFCCYWNVKLCGTWGFFFLFFSNVCICVCVCEYGPKVQKGMRKSVLSFFWANAEFRLSFQQTELRRDLHNATHYDNVEKEKIREIPGQYWVIYKSL
jgi:hypothetical protein